eukprot:m.83533 g.83533  ORF g.83533 m.83533 type:complete len:707 (+) comp36353_c0_seq2:67-2187(+)
MKDSPLGFLIVTTLLLSYVASRPTLHGLSLVDSSASLCSTSSAFCASQGKITRIRLFGVNFSNKTLISVTKNERTCDASRHGPFSFEQSNGNKTSTSGLIEVDFPDTGLFYFCLADGDPKEYVHQGNEIWNNVEVTSSFALPLWVSIVLVCLLMVFSGLFSGLNLGLMALDPMELKVVMRGGSKKEQGWAKKIEPIRRRGNYLLCTLLFGNVLVNSAFTILLDDLTSGIVAVVASTIAIVIFGEIIPQSICSRHGLRVGAHTIWLTYLFMIVTFPISYPISKILDCVLGDEVGTVYNRRQLLELVRVTENLTDLDKGEVGMLSGVLGFKEKKAEDVMTKLDDVFLLDIEQTMLDFRTISEITKSGHSRIPVYEGKRGVIVGILFSRDLNLLDPDDKIPLRTIIKHYNHPMLHVWYDTTLDKVLEQFRDERNHMAIVKRVNDEGENDPFYEVVGVITLEDVIEEIIQSEIVDETDTIGWPTHTVYNLKLRTFLVDNQTRKPIERKNSLDLSHFHSLNSDAQDQAKISPQMALAVFQFLSAEVNAFSPYRILPSVLKRLINKGDVITNSEPPSNGEQRFLYQKGKLASAFTLILHGNVQVTVGKENLTFKRGPFSSFGETVLQCLGTPNAFHTPESPHTSGYVPDYSIELLGSVQYLKITRAHYEQAIEITRLELHAETVDQQRGITSNSLPEELSWDIVPAYQGTEV